MYTGLIVVVLAIVVVFAVSGALRYLRQETQPWRDDRRRPPPSRH